MKFKVDENLPVDVVRVLRQAGHDGVTIVEQQMEGKPDPEVAAICNTEHRALVTLDTDFADIRTYPPEEFHGIVVLRLKQQDMVSVIDVLKRVLPLFSREKLAGKLWIVDERRIRIRE